jgi:hypothetical protein
MDERVSLSLEVLQASQDGLARRAQLIELGLTDNDIRRMRRNREIVAVHDGVYVDHTGPLPWAQRAWAGVLSAWPAALSGESARRWVDLDRRRAPDDGRPIQVVVPHRRTVRPVPRVEVRRLLDFHKQVRTNGSPPVQRSEHWALDLAAVATTNVDAVAVLADAVGARRTTAVALQKALDGRGRIARRQFLSGVIGDVASGTCSTLEHGYLDRVERPHGLPTASRQVLESANGRLFRDVVYTAFGCIVELDGRLHTRTQNADADLERDLDATITGRVTARLGWGQVFDRACSTAFKVGRLIASRGWAGQVVRCPSCPPDLGW